MSRHNVPMTIPDQNQGDDDDDDDDDDSEEKNKLSFQEINVVAPTLSGSQIQVATSI